MAEKHIHRAVRTKTKDMEEKGARVRIEECRCGTTRRIVGDPAGLQTAGPWGGRASLRVPGPATAGGRPRASTTGREGRWPDGSES